MDIFESLESEVRTYCRTWDTVFDRASGSTLYGEDGRDYLDFFSGAGALNYGHNNPELLRPLVESGQIQLANHTWSHPDLTRLAPSRIADDGVPPPVEPLQSLRIGLTKAVDLPWRYGLKGSKFLSKPF